MQFFKIHLTLRTPAILHSLLSLDAVLAAAIFRETGDVEAAHTKIPLANTKGVWHGSCVQLGRGHVVDIGYKSGFRGRDWDPALFTDQRRNGRVRVKVGGGPYMPSIDTYRGWAGEVGFAGFGDLAEVKRLLEALPGIGRKARHGHGEIASLEVERLDQDCSVAREGAAQRPVPIDLCKPFGIDLNERTPRDRVRWAPPYWSGEAVECAVPSLF